MKRLDRYILKNLLIALAIVTASLTFAIWLSQSLRFLDFIVKGGAPVGVFVSLIVLTLPQFFSIILPIGVLASTLFVYNRFLSDSELVVMRSCGVSQWGLAKPALILAAATTGVVLVLNLKIVPDALWAFEQQKHIARAELSNLLFREGVFTTVKGQITIYVRERDDAGGLENIVIHDGRDPQRPVTVLAERGVLLRANDGPRLVVFSGTRQEFDGMSGRLSQLTFDQYAVDLALVRDDLGPGRPDYFERPTADLIDPPPDLSEKEQRQFAAELHSRLSRPLLSIAFVMAALGALLSGEFSRRGQTLRIMAAIVVALPLQALSLGLANAAVNAPAALVGLYALPVLVIVGGAIAMTRRPSRRVGGQAGIVAAPGRS